ncbi:MAG TPA: glucosaminidase domain-containing protein [Ktedonobacteraceae bacterium]|nr:glucosaminidase domain-containing protein [Ktedonobacteraceae bacterium]
MLYVLSPHRQRRMGCFSRFGCLVVVIGIGICVLLTMYPASPFRLPPLPPLSNPFTPPTPVSHGKPSVRVLAASEGGGLEVRGMPTLSVAFVNRVLAAAHSPAQGTGQALYDLSKQYGIDDVYALAFFQHESQFGTTGVARVTRSLGNIRCSSGYRCIDGYRAYASWQAGYEDWYQLVRSLYITRWHLTTVQQIVPVYAPASDHNDVQAYIAAIVHAVAVWRAGQVEVK